MSDNQDLSIMVGDVKFNYRVGVIFEYNGKVLIEKGEAAHGVIPGGRVKTLEDTKNTIIREIQEEMHYDISKKEMKLQSVIENFFISNGVKFHELYFVYKIKLNEDDEIVKRSKEELINYDSECNYYKFIDLDKIDNEIIKPDVLKEIFKEDEFRTVVVRDYEGE